MDNLENKFLLTYFSPFLLSKSIPHLISGSFYSTKYSINYVGIQARMISLIFIFIALYLLYDAYIKIPKSIGGSIIIKKIMSRLIRSYFLYTFLLSLIMSCVIIFYSINYGWIIYICMLIITFIVQLSYNNDIKIIIDDLEEKK